MSTNKKNSKKEKIKVTKKIKLEIKKKMMMITKNNNNNKDGVKTEILLIFIRI